MFGRVLKDITTGINGEDFDISRVIMTANTAILLPVLIIGVGLYVYGYLVNHPFPIEDFFDSVLKFEEGVGALLVTGSMSILFKKQTEPNGGTTDETIITRGQQPRAAPEVQNTTIVEKN